MKPRVMAVISRIRKKERELGLILAVVGASACIGRGIALLSEPAAWIFAGLALLAIAYLCLAEA